MHIQPSWMRIVCLAPRLLSLENSHVQGVALNLPRVAECRDAFVNPGTAIVGHGCIAIKEVIVPLVKFERKAR